MALDDIFIKAFRAHRQGNLFHHDSRQGEPCEASGVTDGAPIQSLFSDAEQVGVAPCSTGPCSLAGNSA